MWFDAVGFPCSVKDGGKALFKSICGLLALHANMDEYDPHAIEPSVMLVEDPMEVDDPIPMHSRIPFTHAHILEHSPRSKSIFGNTDKLIF